MAMINPQFQLEQLKFAIKEETYCESILLYRRELINEFIKVVHSQEETLNKLSQETDSFSRDIVTLELDRVKYYLKKYFRIRNQKIEKNIFYIVREDLNRLLSKVEMEYAINFYQLLMKQYKDVFFQKVDDKYGETMFANSIVKKDGKKSKLVIIEPPNEDKYIFIRFMESIDKLALEAKEVISLHKGNLLFVKHKLVKGLLNDGKVVIV